MLILDLNEVEEVTHHIHKFRDFLIACWPLADEVIFKRHHDNAPAILAKWVQANGEFLIERGLLSPEYFIQPIINKYRISSPDATPDHILFCKITPDPESKLNDNLEELTFVSIGTAQNKKAFKLAPPFDFIKTVDKKNTDIILPWHQCKFFIKCVKITPHKARMLHEKKYNVRTIWVD